MEPGHVVLRLSLPAGEAPVTGIGKHIFITIGADGCLPGLPEFRLQQFAMQFLEDLAYALVAEEEGVPFLGEDILRSGAEPGFFGHFELRVRGRRYAAEVTLGEIADFVVIVEHHPTVTGDAEVLQQHVAGEDVGTGHVAQGITIAFHYLAQFLVIDLLDDDVQRRYTAFDVKVADDDLVVLELDTGSSFLA